MTAPWPVVVVSTSLSFADRHVHTAPDCQGIASTMETRDARQYELRECPVCDVCAEDTSEVTQDHGYYRALERAE